MTKLQHDLECGHVLSENKSNSASPRQNVFCEPCRGHMSVIRTREFEANPIVYGLVELNPTAEDVNANVIDISADETPEIHEDDDAPL